MKTVTHLIFAEPRTPVFRQALAAVDTGDRLLFLGNGVLAATRTDALTVIGDLEDIFVGVSQTDLEERGLLDYVGDEAIVVLDDDALVEWLLASPLNRSWR